MVRFDALSNSIYPSVTIHVFIQGNIFPLQCKHSQSVSQTCRLQCGAAHLLHRQARQKMYVHVYCAFSPSQNWTKSFKYHFCCNTNTHTCMCVHWYFYLLMYMFQHVSIFCAYHYICIHVISKSWDSKPSHCKPWFGNPGPSCFNSKSKLKNEDTA